MKSNAFSKVKTQKNTPKWNRTDHLGSVSIAELRIILKKSMPEFFKTENEILNLNRFETKLFIKSNVRKAYESLPAGTKTPVIIATCLRIDHAKTIKYLRELREEGFCNA